MGKTRVKAGPQISETRDNGASAPGEDAAAADGDGGGAAEFAALGVSAASCAVLARLGFSKPTPVQAACIPLFRGNKDVAVDACTGSGKTLAFVLPVVDKLRELETPLKRHQVGAMVVSPTRELAKQIMDVAAEFVASVANLSAMLLVGGSDPAQDVARFKEGGGQVLIGTPGRLHDIMTRCAVMDTKALEVLVLDEADRLLDMGFQRQLDAIMAKLPKQRRTGLFSATQTEAVEALSRAGLRNPMRVQVAVASKPTGKGGEGQAQGGQVTPSSLSIYYLLCEADGKLGQLVHFLRAHRKEKVIVYFLTCAVVDFYLAALDCLEAAMGLNIYGLHGRMKQSVRERTLSQFAADPHGVLFATDVAARGLDIPLVHWIVQVDPPQDPSAFVHRVGRTARMGQAGSALALLLPHEEPYVEFLRLRKIPLTPMECVPDVPTELLTEVRRVAESDRDVMEKGTRAFVSYVRGYKEHQCRFIFRFPELDLGRMATAFALLQLPKMKEIKKSKWLADFKASEVEPASVPYKDKAREKQRRKLLAAHAAEKAAKGAARKAVSGEGAPREASTAPPAAVDQKVKRVTAEKRRMREQRMEMDELNDEYSCYGS